MSNNLCWNCQNACGGCNWSRNLTPVEGWTATPIKIKRSVQDIRGSISGYQIHSCPEYVPETAAKKEPEVRKKIPKHIREEIKAMIKSGLSKREVARRTGISNNTVIKISREA